MTGTELVKRSQNAENLRVFQVDADDFLVESADKKICYKVNLGSERQVCSCADFVTHTKTDEQFRCKHIIAVGNSMATHEAENCTFLERVKPRLDERFVIAIDDREFVRYPGLLDLGHQKGIVKIEVDPLQYPKKDNEYMAICKALVVSTQGETFIDIGDANPENCSSKVRRHLLRMASTRAIARALRSFTNIGMTCFEELADFDEATGKEPAHGAARPQRRKLEPVPSANRKGTKTIETKGGATTCEAKNKEGGGNGNGGENQPPAAKLEKPNNGKISAAQIIAVQNLVKRRGMTPEEVEKKAADMFGTKLEDLSAIDAASFIRQLQQSA